ncbi:hypothetical protein C2G38_2186733 [Gigaspora rosea]|uniref:SWIM-type domain-containing protein n=1 Tax=Gigaspora rosea TaxID=44941 RepID=A0A397V6J7_9GLOM|nr:hypothetical protein C2G38_2186733 [Gigaspora rosea]
MLPCKHIFYEQKYGHRKLLTIEAWRQFQQMFSEVGFEIYEHRELVSIESFEKDENYKATEGRRLTINKLMERTRNQYWSVEENGNENEKVEFIQILKIYVDVELELSRGFNYLNLKILKRLEGNADHNKSKDPWVYSRLEEYFTRWIAFGKIQWVEYIKREYLKNCKKWIDAYHQYEHQEMDTTNFIESWHKKLKYTHLRARQNHRIDSLIWTLRTALKDAEFEYESVYVVSLLGNRYYYVKSSKDNSYEVYIKEHIPQSNSIKPAYLECTCPDFKFRGMVCKHVFTVCQKFYPTPVLQTTFAQREKEPKKISKTKFEDWVDTKVRKKSNISLYDECKIPESDKRRTYDYIRKQRG